MQAQVASTRSGRKLLATLGTVVDGRYRLDALLGMGGFGEVWQATQIVSETEAAGQVAIKLLPLPPALAPVAGAGATPSQQAWLEEARIVRALKSDAIVPIYDVGTAANPPLSFIVMELLQGETLEQRVERGPMHFRRALAIACSIAAALEACHAQGVSHCDLKPQNVFLTRDGRVRVLDFGVAATSGELRRNTPSPSVDASFGQLATQQFPPAAAGGRAGQVDSPMPIGTPGYIPPEGFSERRPAPAGDVYALGVTLCRMLTGRLPYRLSDAARAEDDSGTARSQRLGLALTDATIKGELEKIASLGPDLPLGVCDLVERMLAKDPRDRPSKLVAEIARVSRRPNGLPKTPYVGLGSFGVERAGELFGRDGDIEHLVNALATAPAVFLCGPSGCGKSSLAIAGVAARISEILLDDLDGWDTVIVRPSKQHATEGIARMQRLITERPRDTRIGTVVVADQLEEVLELEPTIRKEFCATLLHFVQAGKNATKTRVVASVRGDFFAQVAALPELERVPERHLYTVRAVDPNAVPKLVRDPASEANFTIPEKDAELIIDEVKELLAADAGALPLVQFTLTRWWDTRNQAERLLNHEMWKAIGGTKASLATTAKEIYTEFESADQAEMKAVMIALFSTRNTRVAVPQATFAESARRQKVIDALVKRQLVRLVGSGSNKAYEVVHEALATHWQELKDWLKDSQPERELVEELEQSALRWLESQKSSDRLWPESARLRQAQGLRAKVKKDSQEFIDASLAAIEKSLVRSRVVRGLIAGLMVAALAFAVSFEVVRRERSKVSDDRDRLAKERESLNRQLSAKVKLAEAANGRADENERLSKQTLDESQLVLERSKSAIDSLKKQLESCEGTRAALDKQYRELRVATQQSMFKAGSRRAPSF
jgi:serine/threonine protein kinase